MSAGAPLLRRIRRNTADLERAVGFYTGALGFTVDATGACTAWSPSSGAGRPARRRIVLTLGRQAIELAESAHAAAYPTGTNAADPVFQHCAIVVRDMPAAYRRVLQAGATPITRGGPQTLPPSTGSVAAFKFRDPDGHPLELIAFPSGSGDPVWQDAVAPGPALGIDHSAISVTDVDRSIAFYQCLGLKVASRGINRGAAQERLDDLAAVEVEVVAMQGRTRTPHLELLAYRHPREAPHAALALDAIAADRVLWQTNDLEVSLDVLAVDFPAAVITRDGTHGAASFLLRDPDGHLLGIGDFAT